MFVDPARRSGTGSKRVGDSEPPLEWCLDLHRSVGRVGIKAVPGLPHEVVPPGMGDGVRGRGPRPEGDRGVVTRARNRQDAGHHPSGWAHPGIVPQTNSGATRAPAASCFSRARRDFRSAGDVLDCGDVEVGVNEPRGELCNGTVVRNRRAVGPR
ncbi:MAG: hypothetical protein ACRDRH_03485 [Pseudonocardia sp.]